MSDHHEFEDNFNRGLEKLLEITSKLLETSETIGKNWGHIIHFNDSKIRESYDTISKISIEDLPSSFINILGYNQADSIIEPEIEIIESIGNFTILVKTEGAQTQDVKIKVKDNIIIFEAICRERHYYKELSFWLTNIDHMEWACNEGMVKIVIEKVHDL